MLDVREVRENSARFEADLEKRKQPEKVVWLKDLVEKDREYREVLSEIELLRGKRNGITKEIEKLKAARKPFQSKIGQAKKIPMEIKSLEAQLLGLRGKIDSYLFSLPNPLHESVPVGNSDLDNRVVRFGGKQANPGFPLMHHGELAAKLGQADFERAAKISGAGFFFLKNDLALLDFALIRFAVDELLKKGFELTLPPVLMHKKQYEGVTDLEAFRDVLYKVEGEDLFLIATSEHPMAAMYSGEIFEETSLPIRLCGVSPCFRKEVGKHGLDERGLFRVHQFNKVEQFVFCLPEESWGILEELVKNAEHFLDALGVHYVVTNVCSGDIGAVAAKKYDINAWSPREKKYIELMSISNCTNYQSVGLGIKCRKKGGEKEFVHTLNGTMVATSRAMRILIENNQTKEGVIKIPQVLWPYMGGKKEIVARKAL